MCDVNKIQECLHLCNGNKIFPIDVRTNRSKNDSIWHVPKHRAIEMYGLSEDLIVVESTNCKIHDTEYDYPVTMFYSVDQWVESGVIPEEKINYVLVHPIEL